MNGLFCGQVLTYGMTYDQTHSLFSRLKADDRHALQEIFEQNYGKVCGAMQRLIKDQTVIEDLAQEVFVRFWQKRHQIEIATSLEAYLRRMAVNEALAHLRSRKVFTEEIDDHAHQIRSSSSGDGEARVIGQEMEKNIRAAIDELPPKCRAVFQLSRFEELSYQEIADRLDISIKTVENQMGKALKTLRESLQQYLQA
jgi:RNA polymerase sigma-70 factor, ECF subfamily